jgi:hypothetical protein
MRGFRSLPMHKTYLICAGGREHTTGTGAQKEAWG